MDESIQLLEETDAQPAHSLEYRLGTDKGRACVVQWISTPVFGAASLYVFSHATTHTPSLWSSITLYHVPWLVGFICAIESVGQTPLALAVWRSDNDPSWSMEFRDEFMRKPGDPRGAPWVKGVTPEVTIYSSHAAYVSFLCLIPAARWTLATWAWGYPQFASTVGALILLLSLAGFWRHASQWAFVKPAVLLYLISPLMSGLSLISRAYLGGDLVGEGGEWTSLNEGLLRVGFFELAYIFSAGACAALPSYKRWHAEAAGLFWFWGSAIGASMIRYES